MRFAGGVLLPRRGDLPARVRVLKAMTRHHWPVVRLGQFHDANTRSFVPPLRQAIPSLGIGGGEVGEVFGMQRAVCRLAAVGAVAGAGRRLQPRYLRIVHRHVGYLLNFGQRGELEWKRLIDSDLHPRGIVEQAHGPEQ